MDLKIWFRETRPNFLLITPLIFSVGLALAYVDGYFDALSAIIGLVGAVLAHISINVLNDYFDFRSGLDMMTKRTPFSGGSGMLPAGLLRSRDVYLFAVGCLALDGIIGLYFALLRGWLILPLVLVSAASIYFYTTHLSRWLVGEIVTGLNFGPLMVMGSYFIQTGGYSLEALVSGMVPGILIGTLLFLNEFPDVAADKEVGRNNIIIKLGTAKSSRIYASLIASAYAWILGAIILGLMPVTAAIVLITLPIAFRAVKGVLINHQDVGKLIPAMAANVMLDLTAIAAMAIGIFLSVFL